MAGWGCPHRGNAGGRTVGVLPSSACAHGPYTMLEQHAITAEESLGHHDPRDAARRQGLRP
jgi:hypothetical protein